MINFEDYLPMVRKLTIKHAGKFDEDLYQEGVIALWYYSSKYDETKGAKPITYLYKCVDKIMLRAKFKNNSIKPVLTSEGYVYSTCLSLDMENEDGQNLYDKHSYSINLDEAIYIEDIMEKLTERDRTVLNKLVSGYNMSEIAEQLNISRERVRQIKTKIGYKVRNYLRKNGRV